MKTTPVVLRIFGSGPAYLCVEAPTAPNPTALLGDAREQWRRASRLSREMGWGGAVRVVRPADQRAQEEFELGHSEGP